LLLSPFFAHSAAQRIMCIHGAVRKQGDPAGDHGSKTTGDRLIKVEPPHEIHAAGYCIWNLSPLILGVTAQLLKPGTFHSNRRTRNLPTFWRRAGAFGRPTG